MGENDEFQTTGTLEDYDSLGVALGAMVNKTKPFSGDMVELFGYKEALTDEQVAGLSSYMYLQNLVTKDLFHMRGYEAYPVKGVSEPISGSVTVFIGPDDVEDNWLDFANPTENNGLHAGSTASNTQSATLIRIIQGRLAAVLGTGKIIDSMKMYFYLNATSNDADKTMRLYRVLKNWVAGAYDGTVPAAGSGSTFNTYDGTNAWETAGCLGDTDRDPMVLDSIFVYCVTGAGFHDRLQHGYRKFVIPKEIAQVWYSGDAAGGISNNGLIIRQDVNQFIHGLTTQEIGYLPAEPGDNRPFFVVEYHDAH